MAFNADIGLKERTFIDGFENVILYVTKFDLRNKKLIDVYIEDKRQPDMVSTVVAPAGGLISESDKSIIHLQHYHGTIHQTHLKN